MEAGIFGLLGVVIGALTTGATTWVLDRRRERRDAQTAARIVREDVVFAGPALETTLRRGWLPQLDLRSGGWEEYRAVLARELPKPAWEEVAQAFELLQHVRIILATTQSGSSGIVELNDIPPDGQDIIRQAISQLEKAVAALEPLV